MATIPTTIGRFQIRSRIGQGGMGALYLAWDPMLEREIAIKVLREDNDELRERFSREARSVARLRHPHIVMIFDVGEQEGQPFIAMEYIKGQTLAEIIRTPVPLNVIRKLELVEELCDGLGFAHKAGIVHRDIKPANMIVDDQGSLKILDFGIARVGPGMTQAGMLIGTLNYMSPEQVRGNTVDGRSDIFAVGLVLYELLAYRQAFSGGLEGGILHKILHQSPEPLDKICGGLDPQIIQIVTRALEKAPADRYQDLPAMQKDLRRVRQRIEASQPTFDVPDVSASAPTVAIEAGGLTPTPRTPRLDREALARRRATQIEACLGAAEKALGAGDYEGAIAQCEEVLLLDSENARATDLLDRAKAAIDERQVDEWLNEAQRQIERGELTGAHSLVQKALALSPASSRSPSLLQVIQQKREEQERQRARVEARRVALARARELFDHGSFEAAVAAADEMLVTEPADSGALSIKQRAVEVIEAKRREALSQRAKQTVAEARRAFQAGQYAAAIKLLEDFDAPHPEVTHALNEFKSELEARRREEERRRQDEHRAEAERQERARRVRAALDQAKTSLAQRDFAAALQVLRPLQQTDSGAAGLQSLIAEAEAQQADAERARRIASEIRDHLDAASARFDARDLDAAMSRVQKALALDPTHRDARALATRIQDALRAAAEQREADARRQAEQREADARRQRARERAMTDAMARANTASSHELAVAALREALSLDPNFQPAQHLLKERQTALDRERAIAAAFARAEGAPSPKVAIAALRQVLQIDPNHTEARRRLHEREADLAREEAEARRARERQEAVAAAMRDATNAPTHQAALTALRRALELDPNHSEARRLFETRDVALKKEQAEERRRQEIESACREIEAHLSSGALDAAELAVAALEEESDARKAVKPLRRRLKQERASAAKARKAEVGKLVPREASGLPRPVAVYVAAAVALVVVLFAVGYRALRPDAAPAPGSNESPALTPAARPPLQTADRPAPNAPVPNAPVPPPAPVPSQAAPVDQRGDIERQVGPLRLLARQQFARGQRQQALDTALAGLKLLPQDDELQGVLADLSREANASVRRARAAATAAGSASSPPFREAMAKQQEAARLARSAGPAESLRSYWDAADLFTRAAEQGQIAGGLATQSPPAPVQTVPPSPGAKPADTASPANEPPSSPVTAPPQQPPAQAPVTAPPQPPPGQSRPTPPSLNDDAAILSTLRAYEQAYSTLNLDAVKRVFPGVNATALGQAFNQMRAQRVQILNEQVSVAGTTATVTCQVHQRFEPKAGRASEATVNAVFRLQKAGSEWVIVERR